MNRVTTFSNYFLLLFVGFLTIVPINTAFGQDVLDGVDSRVPLILELKDMFRAYHIQHLIAEQKELINLTQDQNSDTALQSLLEEYRQSCNELKKIPFHNAVLQSKLNTYLTSTEQNYAIAQKKGFTSPEFKKDATTYGKIQDQYLDYLYATFASEHFIELTEETYWKTMNKKQYIKAPEYATYLTLKTTDWKKAMTLLEQLVQKTTDFQEYTIYQLEWADQYVKHANDLDESAYETAVEKYKAILDKNQYCLYLFEAWLKWRMVSQQHLYGLSKTSEIPNATYDALRAQVAKTLLEYIATHEKDTMAINAFLVVATHDIVKRFGPYPYGNQNTVEYHQTFDEN